MKAIVVIFFLLFTQWFTQNTNQAYILTVQITGKKNTNGFIIINLYNKALGFPAIMSKAIRSKKIAAADSLVQVNFEITGGEYAVSVLHDANNNGKMDKNFLGIPTEGYCVSNNVKGIMSAPSFTAAKFTVYTNTTQILKLIY